MANFEIDTTQETVNQALRKIETSDPVHANVYNLLFEQLINNDAFLERLANKMIQKAMVAHVLDSNNANMVLGADQAPALTALIDVERERITRLNSDIGNLATLKLVWVNPDAGANLAFSAQTINLETTPYNAFRVFFRRYGNESIDMQDVLLNEPCHLVSGRFGGSIPDIMQRRIYITSNTIEIGDSSYQDSNGRIGYDNKEIVPIKIFGYMIGDGPN